MVTKFNYLINDMGLVVRTPDYSFTAIEGLSARLEGIDNQTVVSNIANTTLKGEAERDLIEKEDEWFKAQTEIQNMNLERAALEKQMKNGDVNGNPLTQKMQESIVSRIAELNEGTLVVVKEFYNHYTRVTSKVEEIHQTPYTVALEKRTDLETSNLYLKGYRGVENTPSRPVKTLSSNKETEIRKELVRQKIDIVVGDTKDLLADMSGALSALIKTVNGLTLSDKDTTALAKYIERKDVVDAILATDYRK